MAPIRIVLAYDASPSARAAIAAAGRLLQGAEALVVDVVGGLDRIEHSVARAALPDEVIRTGAARLRETALAAARQRAEEGAELATAAGLRAEPRALAVEGAVAPGLLRAAADHDAQLIGCGTRGHGAIARAMLGSVSSGLLAHSPLPVLVVSAQAAEDRGPLLVGHDGSAGADRALEACARLQPDGEVAIVHAWSSALRHTLAGRALAALALDELHEIVAAMDDDDASHEQATTARAGERAAGLGLRHVTRCVESAESTADVLLQTADEIHAAALVVGRRGRGAVTAAVLGSVSSALVHAAARPMLVVP